MEAEELFSGFARAFVDTCAASGAPVGDLTPGAALSAREEAPECAPGATVYAIGDLHGDVDKALSAYALAGLVDEHGRWRVARPGSVVAVQLGDLLDRGGNGEVELLLTQERLRQEASASGCTHVGLLGNHEVMAMRADTRYATECACADFARWEAYRALGARLEQVGSRLRTLEDSAIMPFSGNAAASALEEDRCAARSRMLEPGSPVSRQLLGNRPAVSLLRCKSHTEAFAHGGLLQQHSTGEAWRHINGNIQSWVRDGNSDLSKTPPNAARGRESVIWSRHYSYEDEGKCDCSELKAALASLKASRLIVGHTIQKSGINAACDGAVLRADVGMSEQCRDAPPQVVEISPDGSSTFRLQWSEDGSTVERVPLTPLEQHH